MSTSRRPNVLQVIAGALAGLVVALVFVIGVEFLSAIFHPFPPDFGGTSEEICAHVARYPRWFLALVVPAWGLTALAGTWISRWLGGRPAALFVGILLVVAVLCNVAMLPYPNWFKLLSPLAVAAAIAAVLRRPAGQAAES